MSKSKLLAVALVVVAPSVFIASPSWSGSVAGNGGATEVTQILNNSQLTAQLGQQIKTVSTAVAAYQRQYLQLQQQLKSGLNVGGPTLGDINRIKYDYDRYQGSLRDAGMDLASLQTVYDRRMVEAKVSNMPLDSYLVLENKRIAEGDARAKARLIQERSLIEQTNADMEAVKTYGGQINTTAGEHDAIALLNRQMNLLLQQNSRMQLMMAQSLNSDKVLRDSKEQEQQISVDAFAQSVQARNEAIRAAQAQALEQFKPKQ
jgi:hypothetical protein